MQGWADDLDFGRQKVTVEEAVLDRDQGQAMAEDRDGQETRRGVNTEETKQRQKGKQWEVGYDKLVISVGCYSQTFGTKGVREHAFFLKDIGDARRVRKRILELFEIASLPVTSESVRKQLLRFAVVGGGPTGMEFAAELSDLVHEDLRKIYPDLAKNVQVIVYDVAPRVLSMFDESLGDYATKTYKRGGIDIKTYDNASSFRPLDILTHLYSSHHVEELRPGLPKSVQEEDSDEERAPEGCYTIRTKEDGDIGIGMCVWSTGNMMNPLVEKTTSKTYHLPSSSLRTVSGGDLGANEKGTWAADHNERTGAFMVDSKFRLQLTHSPVSSESHDSDSQALLPNVFALGDNAAIRDHVLPATAQTANQEAIWLAKRLNSNTQSLDEVPGFEFRDMGIMTYLGNARGLVQAPGGEKGLGRWGKGLRGRAAWLVWRGAYLWLSISWRNRVLIPVYW